jgi:hypothetical protein
VTSRKRIGEAATRIILEHPAGIRWAELFRAVSKALPDENQNTIVGSLHHFRNNLPEGILRPDRGIYASAAAPPELAHAELTDTSADVRRSEESFYQPFADWLVGELEEATVAEVLGGNSVGGKWGTPDVIGLFQPRRTDPIQFTEEVVAVEIKVDTTSLITAFGQACAYSYLHIGFT